MSKQEIGLCALLTGSSSTSEAFEVLPAYVEMCVQEIRYEVSATLKAFREVVKRKAQETSNSQAAESFKLPLSVVDVVIGKTVASVQPDVVMTHPPQKPTEVMKSPQKPVEVMKSPQKPDRKAEFHQRAEETLIKLAALKKAEPPQAEQPKPTPSQEPKIAIKERRISERPAKTSERPVKTSKAVCSSSESEQVKSLRMKIGGLYRSGVKFAVIAALYKLPIALVHTWGDWTQLSPTKAEENRSLANSAKELIASGVAERDVMEALGIKNQKNYSYLMGRFEIPKSYSSEQKIASVDYTKLVRNVKKASEELEIPHKRLRAWANKDDLTSDEDFLSCGKGMKRDEERLRALEEYYLNNKSVSAAAKSIGQSDVYKIINWVTEFEKTCMSTPKKRQKLAEATDTLEIDE
jgi:transposase